MKIIINTYLIVLLFSITQYAQNGEFKFEGEIHLCNIRMLTEEGENAEAYFSFDENKLIL